MTSNYVQVKYIYLISNMAASAYIKFPLLLLLLSVQLLVFYV